MKHGLAQVKNHTVRNTFTLLLGLVSRHLLRVTFTIIAESLMEWITDALKSVNCGLEVVRNSSHGTRFELDFSPLWPSFVTYKLVFFLWVQSLVHVVPSWWAELAAGGMGRMRCCKALPGNAYIGPNVCGVKWAASLDCRVLFQKH